MVTDAQWKISNSEAGHSGRGKHYGGIVAAGVGGRTVIDDPLSKPSTARGRAASQWVGTGGGARRGAGKDGALGGGCRRS